MKKTKVLSLLLCLSLLCALLVPGPAAHADAADSGMNISKTATRNDDGSYTITLEAFATGSKTTIVQEKDIPTDIILVLDQSTSMAEGMGDVQYTQYTGKDTRNETNFENRHNGGYANLWYQLPDGSYASVSVKRLRTNIYNQIGLDKTNKFYFDNREKLYTKVNGKFEKVVCTKEYDASGNSKYTYTLENGTTLNEDSGGDDFKPTFPNTDEKCLYVDQTDESQNKYTYTYTDSDGNSYDIGESTGAKTSFSPSFYQCGRTTTGEGSLDVLKSAAADFVNTVAAKAAGKDSDIATTADNIDHRIAVVGFGSESGNGNNTELLSIAGSNSGSVGVVYNSSITDQNLKDVLQSMNTQSGQDMVNAAIGALAAEGTTRTDLGMEMAQKILNANPVPAGETRNRVVIVFTDGAPTNNNGFERDWANRAITTSNAIKAGGTTVYSIGIFPGADASTAGVEPDEDLYEIVGIDKNYTEAQMSAACNWFMQNVSSNNGTPRTPSYYLSVGDSASLSSIFQQISGQIQTGGSETTLGSNTVVKDIIAPAFTLSDGETESSIQIATYACTGKNGNSYTWATTGSGADGASATVDGDQVSVTGFDFSENWCGIEKDAQGTDTARGRKLVISFTVKLKSGFLGGNDVPTNADAGIYKDGTTDYPVLRFEKPTVNVPIKDVTVTAAEKNVYLLGNVTADDLKSGATVKVGDVELKLDQPNYGLEPWQTEYVNITVTVKDKDGNAISAPLSNLSDDTTYTVEVTVSPKTSGSTTNQGTPATAKTGTDTAKINVFKPALTFKDSDVYYGDNAPTDYSGNLTTTQWKHDDTLSTDSNVTMTGTPPELGLTCTPENGKIASGKINTKQDVPVTAAVSISGRDVTSYTTFEHQACTSGCGWTTPATHGAPAFLLHVKTCTLNITKAGGAADESYVFDVYKDGTKYSEVTVWGNSTETLVELPVGTYTITENTGWRYSASYSGDATLSATTPEGTITCTNRQENGQWLNGFSAIVRNIFGQEH